jgi:large subunit ribosomal protein L17
MRHRKKFNHLSRKSAHRKAMLSNMAISLIEHKRIKTTVAKAKALRVFVEPLINRSKTDTTHSRRMVFKKLQNKQAVNELFREISQRVADRQGGYTRILKTGNRLGDNAEMCIIELVDYNENYFTDKLTTKKKRTRRGRSKSETEVKTVEPQEETVVSDETEVPEEVTEELSETTDDTEETAEDLVEDVKSEDQSEEVKDESEDTTEEASDDKNEESSEETEDKEKE